MKDKKFIVLQIQTAPSRLQPASARCFLAAIFYQVLHLGFVRMRNMLCYLPAGLAFQNIGVPSRPQHKLCNCNQKAETMLCEIILILFEWKHHYSVTACHPPQLFRNASGRSYTWLSLTRHANIRDGHLSNRIRYLRVWQFKGLRNRYCW